MSIDNFRHVPPDKPGIQGQNEYFNSAVLVLVMNVSGEDCFVLQRRSKNIRQGGEICFPGGMIDANDQNALQAALRETEEELGIDSEMISVLGQLDTIVAPMGATVEAFLAYMDHMPVSDFHINEAEVEELIILPVSQFMKPDRYSVRIEVHPTRKDDQLGEDVVLLPVEMLGLPARYTKPWGGFEYGVYVYQTEYGVVWGITARLIHDVVSKL